MGTEVSSSASDMKSWKKCFVSFLKKVYQFTQKENHFSNWLKRGQSSGWQTNYDRGKSRIIRRSMRCEKDLITSLHHYRHIRQRGIISDFSKDAFDPESSFARMAADSLGGKAARTWICEPRSSMIIKFEIDSME